LRRRQPIGAEVVPGRGTHFRVWAPKRTRVSVQLEGNVSGPARGGGEGAAVHPLEREEGGYFSGVVQDAEGGTLYRFCLDDEPRPYPDPASRRQPEGPHGPSCVVDPAAYRWGDGAWGGVTRAPVLYEMHVGTFTREGTWAAAETKLPHLADVGVTVLQVMPVADFPGRFGWGYDGVSLFAPYHGYGTPDDFRRFVEGAHAHGLAVILDVVYNHLGPDGNYLGAFSDAYQSRRHTTEWGPSLDFDGEGSGPVREYCASNVRHWVEEYHVDGFRFDATQDLKDDSPEHVLALLAREARVAAGTRRTLLVAENEPQQGRIVEPAERGGYGIDMILNDDFHHSAVAALAGVREGYYSQHFGRAQELLSAVKHGFLYQGQWYPWQGKRRGTPTRGIPRAAFVHFLENHDQVSNSASGKRLHQLTSPGAWRALVALTLLGPQTPYLFQGQEFASTPPFLYFADQPPELAELTWRGRLAFLEQFRNLSSPEMIEVMPRPSHEDTFRRCKLRWEEREENREALSLHRDLLRIRREDAPFTGTPELHLDGAVLAAEAFVLRAFGAAPDGSRDRLLLVNLGGDLFLAPAPEPLLAPPTWEGWEVLWSSESPAYGGRGTPPVEGEAWNLPGGCALLMAPATAGARRHAKTEG
jgi:maltooligosyltrehalose trehalohydrolase